MKERKVLVIGLDCASPRLVFETWRADLPNLSRLMEEGLYGPLRSTDPPITVPAWMSMVTGQDPGMLGIYGFRNRRDHSYNEMAVANRLWVQAPTLWDILTEQGKTSICIGIPGTYPPRPMRGITVAGILTPDEASNYTYPRVIRLELDRLTGGYRVDAGDFRTEDKARLLEQIRESTRRRFVVVKDFLVRRPWDFFMFVEIGVDRLHHGFWRYMDSSHPRYEPDHPYGEAARDYYRMIDDEVGQILDLIPQETVVLVVSDHGARPMVGGFRINEFLLREGLLTVRRRPSSPATLSLSDVDWARTKAWGEGGYYSRIFMNVRGREPEGIIDPNDYGTVREEIANRLEAVTDQQGRHLGNRVLRPETLYRGKKGVPPDLMVYPGDLSWRSLGSIGHESLWSLENDTGPDDANHDPLGLFILRDGNELKGNENLPMERALLDVAPTVLHYLGIPPSPDMYGLIIK